MADTSKTTVEEVALELRDVGDGFRWLTSSEREHIAAWALRFRAAGVREVAKQALELIDELRGYAAEGWDWKYAEVWNEETDALRRLAAEVTDADR